MKGKHLLKFWYFSLMLMFVGFAVSDTQKPEKVAIVSVSKPSKPYVGPMGRGTSQLALKRGLEASGTGLALCAQWWPTALRAGWKQEHLETLDKVMYRESRCLPYSHNPDDPHGGSFGLMQINGSWKNWLRTKGVIRTSSDLMIPTINLKAARLIWLYAEDKHGNGWGPWNL